MRHTIVKLLLFSAIFPACREGRRDSSPHLEVRWEMGDNLPDGTYNNTFVLINRSGQKLGKDWNIFYSQLPRKVFQDSLVPIRIEVVNGDFFRIFPTGVFAGLEPGDSVRIDFRANNGLIKESHAPSGMYMTYVRNGTEGEPKEVLLTVKPFDRPEQWTRASMAEVPYPDGARMYALNSRISHQPVGKADMIPTVKKAVVDHKSYLMPKEVAIVAPEQFGRESALLGEKLKHIYGATLNPDAAFRILLTPLPDQAKAVNDEYYRLTTADDGILIEAPTAHGIFNGTTTLLNLLKGNRLPDSIPAVAITDYPDLPYRGQMIDVARNFVKKETLLQLIDVFSSYKINTLHLHLTDDEGWRLEIPGLSELTDVGSRRGHTQDESRNLYPAYGSGPSADDPASAGNGFYSRTDFIELLKYAAERHVRIIPEVDMPGHSRAAIVAMKARYETYRESDPEKATAYLLTDFDDRSVYSSVQEYSDNVVSVSLPSTYRFIDKVVSEIKGMYEEAGLSLSELHIGGDEVPEGAWSDSEQCRELMARENIAEVHALNGYFFNRVNDILHSHGVKTTGWQELAFAGGDDVSHGNKSGYGSLYCWNTMAERGVDVVPYLLANAGYDIIMSNVNNLYFDLSYNRHQSEPGLHWGGFVDEVSSFDVLPYSVYKSTRTDGAGNPKDLAKAEAGKVMLTAEGRKHIRGIQGQLWAENITKADRTQYMLFPKLFGLSERGWNAEPEWSVMADPQAAESAYLSDLSRYYAKITQMELPYLSLLGVNYHVNQPGIRVENHNLLFNSVDPNAEIYYTLDGSDPEITSTRWDGKPVILFGTAPKVKAIAVVRGKKSLVTRL